jgi:ribosome-associated protein
MSEAARQPSQIQITQRLAIPLWELEFQFSRSSGPGGQNVNRRETRVELLFDVQRSPSLSVEQRIRLTSRLARQLDSHGVLRIVVDSERSQLLNRQEALERFVRLVRRGLHVPRARRPTQPSQRTIAQRLARKRHRGEAKALRKRPPPSEP